MIESAQYFFFKWQFSQVKTSKFKCCPCWQLMFCRDGLGGMPCSLCLRLLHRSFHAFVETTLSQKKTAARRIEWAGLVSSFSTAPPSETFGSQSLVHQPVSSRSRTNHGWKDRIRVSRWTFCPWNTSSMTESTLYLNCYSGICSRRSQSSKAWNPSTLYCPSSAEEACTCLGICSCLRP